MAKPSAASPHYDPDAQLLQVTAHGTGYHSTVRDGTTVHPLRESAGHALTLLHRTDSEDHAVAAAILRRLIALQDTDPASPTCGLWSYYLEEPLTRMSPPDWNWADFIGARLVEIVTEHAAKLPEDVEAGCRAAIGHACGSIVRRNVQPGYTNIAVMGGVVTAIAGELLERTDLLDYGRTKLRQCVEHTQHHGSFNEYNSPTYTPLVVDEAERGLKLLHDADARASLMWLADHAWALIAEHFHPATQQWAGPHSRAYHDRLTPPQCRWLADHVGLAIGGREPANDPDAVGPRPDLRERFARLPHSPLTVTRRFIKHKHDRTLDVVGTTWLTDDVCLGTINHGMCWTQARPLLGYWRDGAGGVAVLRLRFWLDGRDFSSAFVHIAQRDGHALAAVQLRPGHGNWHPTLDRPADGVFRASRLTVRIELAAADARVEPAPHGCVLAAGRTHARIVTADDCRDIDGKPMPWITAHDQRDGQPVASFEGVYCEGPPRSFAIPVWTAPFAVLGLVVTADATDLPPPRRVAAGFAWDTTDPLSLTLPSSMLPPP